MTIAVGMLGGCFAYDAPRENLSYRNLTDETLVVQIEGADEPAATLPPAEEAGSMVAGLVECRGTAIIVETEEGAMVGRVDEPACAGWALTIEEDRSLTYVHD